MGVKDLSEYLDKKNEEIEKGKGLDWNEEKKRWLKAVNEFYEKILVYLKPYEGRVQSEKKEVSMYEENIGEYKVKQLFLDILGDRVVFEPIGTLIIGAYGRIDMSGRKGKVRFVLVDKNSDGPKVIARIFPGDKIPAETQEASKKEPELDWKIATEPPKIKYIPLNAEIFADYLFGVMNG